MPKTKIKMHLTQTATTRLYFDNEDNKLKIQKLEDLVERLKLEAQIHAQEARTQEGTVLKIYQSLGIQKGTWDGASPVIEWRDQAADMISRLEHDRFQLAKLACSTPQFYNPIAAAKAVHLREKVLNDEVR